MTESEAPRRACVEINIDALRSNFLQLQQQAKSSQLIAVVKADAYGHGAVKVARALPEADAFAVASVGEAIVLRHAGIKQKILVLSGFIDEQELQQIIDHSLDPVIHQSEQIELLAQHEKSQQLDVWLKIDTGMGRLGFDVSSLPAVLSKLESISLAKIRLMTHLANADVPNNASLTQQQLDKIAQLELADYEWSIANSAGLLAWPTSHKNWVRSGIALYGPYPPLDDKTQLRAVMTFRAPILSVNQHLAGDTIGYASLYRCQQDSRIAVISAGYADGYPRLQNKPGKVLIHGKKYPIVGRVSMDMITVDVTGADEIKVGDQAVMWGQGISVNQVAENAQTISYELLCHAGQACTRKFRDKAK